MLPKHLVKHIPQKVDASRAARMLRFQGLLNVILVLALVGSWLWFYRINPNISINSTAHADGARIRINLTLRAHNGERYVRNQDVVQTPFLTVYGVLSNYAALKDALPDLSVRVNRTVVNAKPETGEFAEEIVLLEGKNGIDITVEWSGEIRERYRLDVTYVKTAPDNGGAATTTDA